MWWNCIALADEWLFTFSWLYAIYPLIVLDVIKLCIHVMTYVSLFSDYWYMTFVWNFSLINFCYLVGLVFSMWWNCIALADEWLFTFSWLYAIYPLIVLDVIKLCIYVMKLYRSCWRMIIYGRVSIRKNVDS